MADNAQDNDDGGDVFVYRGGRAPQHVTHVLIDKSVDEIEERAFAHCKRLLHVETHDGIRKVGRWAFCDCASLPRINLQSVVEIEFKAFIGCENMTDVEIGDELEIIGAGAFSFCKSLKYLKLSSVVIIGLFRRIL
ncbi:MAG: leucine-rich repeat domain-containing protein [Desulfobacteraceae bacterium]|nr:leucine-rich repeat domain-containing protein [Desulfobacteraceae bacterium]